MKRFRIGGASGIALVVLGAATSACIADPRHAAEVVSLPAPASPTLSAEARLQALADDVVAVEVRRNPISAAFLGVEAADHGRWNDNSPEAIERETTDLRRLLAEIRAIDPAALPAGRQRAIHAALVENIDARLDERICRFHLWLVNHLSGWHTGLAQTAKEQPVKTAEQRAQALRRWSSLPAFVDQEIANLRTGLAAGFSAPKPVVRETIGQLERMAATDPAKLPFNSPADRSDDPAFKATFAQAIAGPVRSALNTYLAFLKSDYLPAARDSLAIVAHPDGLQCYEAALRTRTTLDRSADAVFRLGQQTVAANTAFVVAEGRRRFGTDDLATIVRRIDEAPDNRFASEEQLIQYSRDLVDRSRRMSAPLFLAMPAREMRVEPLEAFMRGSGRGSSYSATPDLSTPAYYRIASELWDKETRATAEITAVHEGYPGHHMQLSLDYSLGATPVTRLLGNSAYYEGWARYAETLSEEVGIYTSPYAPMTRRLWPARGMVADPGLHLRGWTRAQVVDYLSASGRFSREVSDDLVDRMAMWPGQLTAYDSGALEIAQLRQEAEAALGDRFDLREFHQRILEFGPMPLPVVRANVNAWIASRRR